jgi:hypothetical protein
MLVGQKGGFLKSASDGRYVLFLQARPLLGYPASIVHGLGCGHKERLKCVSQLWPIRLGIW